MSNAIKFSSMHKTIQLFVTYKQLAEDNTIGVLFT